MQVKIENTFTDDIKELRKKSYAKYNYDGIDEIDETLNEKYKWYINCYKDGELIGSSRLIRKHMPFRDHYDDVETSHNDFEVGRLCIDDRFSATQKFQMLVEMSKYAIGICLAENCDKLFASAKCPNNFIYEKLVGFKQISEPQAYPPLNTGVYLLALDFKKEYNNRKKKFFDLTEDFINSIRMQLNQCKIAA